MTEVFRTLNELVAAKGRTLSPGAAIEVDQPMIDAFAAATHDEQWIHVDAERAAAGDTTTIAHGLLTLSLITPLVTSCFVVDVPASINYGFDRVRFLRPVPVNTRLTATAVIDVVDSSARGTKVRSAVTIANADGTAVCVADWWTFYPGLSPAGAAGEGSAS